MRFLMSRNFNATYSFPDASAYGPFPLPFQTRPQNPMFWFQVVESNEKRGGGEGETVPDEPVPMVLPIFQGPTFLGSCLSRNSV